MSSPTRIERWQWDIVAESLDVWIARSSERNPFQMKLGRVASELEVPEPVSWERRATEDDGQSQVAITVDGIIGHQTTWRAVLRNVGGNAAQTLVGAGEAIGNIQVISVSQLEVVLRGPDSTWHVVMPALGQQ